MRLFENTSSHWVRYSGYEFREKGGALFITSAEKAKPIIYNPLENPETMVVDALNAGMLCMRQSVSEDAVKKAILDFVTKYGLLGFMSALPTTPSFMDYDTVYIPKNPIIKDDSMPVPEYTKIFFPFGDSGVEGNKKSTTWNVVDREMIALALTTSDLPQGLSLSFQRGYSEKYEWMRGKFKDWAYSFLASAFYYAEKDETMRELHRKAMSAFGGIAPTYHIVLADKPVIVWDFHSLLLAVQMVFSLMLTDGEKPLRVCKNCMKVFVASRPSGVFCGHECKNRYNVSKSRDREE